MSRYHPACGHHGDTKLTADLVMQIRKNKRRLSDMEWGKRLGVHHTTIYVARTGRKWKHLPMTQ